MTLLPGHMRFSRVLGSLRLLVVDEAHSYRGVFGSHCALILRRLRRLCVQAYGARPQFVCCTGKLCSSWNRFNSDAALSHVNHLVFSAATIANPKSHMQALLGLSDRDDLCCLGQVSLGVKFDSFSCFSFIYLCVCDETV